MQNDMRDRLVELLLGIIPCNAESCSAVCDGRCQEFDDLDRCQIGQLADHLIANGVLLPPCKVGDMVYCIMFQPAFQPAFQTVDCKLHVEKGFVKEFRITNETLCVNIVDCEHIKYANLNINVPYDAFGKTVFFTKEQAEQKLKEMRADNGKIY